MMVEENENFSFEEKLAELEKIVNNLETGEVSLDDAIEEFKKMGLYTVMLTGDNRRTADAIGKTAGVDLTIADVLPGDKERVVKTLQKYGKAIMVGDSLTSDILGGINAGIKTVWVNPSHKAHPPHIVPDYEIEALSKLEGLLETL